MLKSSTNKMISFCKSRGKQSCDMVRKKCALVACVRVCAQNISREEWFSVPSRTVHPPAHQQKYCPSRGYLPVGHFKIIVIVCLPTNKKCYPSAYLPAFQNVIQPKKNVIRPPTYQQKMLSVHLPTNKKCYPSALPKKCYPSTYLPTKNVIRPPTYQQKKCRQLGCISK